MWIGVQASDAVFWVLDAAKCHLYGDYMPPCALETVAAAMSLSVKSPLLLEKEAIY